MKKRTYILCLIGLVTLSYAKEPWNSHQIIKLQQDDNHPVLLPGSFVIFQSRVLLIDTKAADVKIFKTDGAYVTTFGRPGAGPDEFVMPRFSTLSKNQLLIKEIRKKQLITYDLTQTPPKQLRSDLDMMAANEFIPISDDLMLMSGSIFDNNEFCSLVIYDWNNKKVQKQLVLFRDWIGVSSMMDIVNKMRKEGVSPFAFFDLNEQFIFLSPAAQPTIFRIDRSTWKRIQFGERPERFRSFTGDQERMNKLSSDQTGESHNEFLRLFSQISQVFKVFIIDNNRLGLVYSHYNNQRDALDMYLQVYDFSGKLISENVLLKAQADNSEAIVFHHQKDKGILWVLDTNESDSEGSLNNTLHSFLF